MDVKGGLNLSLNEAGHLPEWCTMDTQKKVYSLITVLKISHFTILLVIYMFYSFETIAQLICFKRSQCPQYIYNIS